MPGPAAAMEVPRVGEPSLAGSRGAEVGQVSRAPVHLDSDLTTVDKSGSIDRGDTSGAENDPGQGRFRSRPGGGRRRSGGGALVGGDELRRPGEVVCL